MDWVFSSAELLKKALERERFSILSTIVYHFIVIPFIQFIPSCWQSEVSAAMASADRDPLPALHELQQLLQAQLEVGPLKQHQLGQRPILTHGNWCIHELIKNDADYLVEYNIIIYIYILMGTMSVTVSSCRVFATVSLQPYRGCLPVQSAGEVPLHGFVMLFLWFGVLETCKSFDVICIPGAPTVEFPCGIDEASKAEQTAWPAAVLMQSACWSPVLSFLPR